MFCQSDQVLQTEVGSARSRTDERIGSREAGPAGWQEAQATVLVPIKDTLLTIFLAPRYRLERAFKQRMVWVRYVETYGRIVRLKRTCLWTP